MCKGTTIFVHSGAFVSIKVSYEGIPLQKIARDTRRMVIAVGGKSFFVTIVAEFSRVSCTVVGFELWFIKEWNFCVDATEGTQILTLVFRTM